MENPYTKQFPELMQGKTILYVHGFGSSAASGTVRLISQTFPEAHVVAYDLPLHPAEAMTLLREKVEADKPDLIIGTSMGGMYAEMLYGVDRICVNPAFEMAQTMKEHGLTGKQTWQNPRQDGETEFLVTKSLEKEYKETTEQCFTALETMTADQLAAERQHVWGLFGDEDPLVHTWDIFRRHYPQAVHFHGAHRMDDRSFMNGVVPVIRWIDDRQEGRERQIVYIDSSCLFNAQPAAGASLPLEAAWDGQPAASLHKAFMRLIETYQVYIVCPSPTNDPAACGRAARWIEQYLSAPAHDHVVFTNQKQLLYGDFFLDRHPADGILATAIPLGSDDFKTWEEVITYFDRLQ